MATKHFSYIKYTLFQWYEAFWGKPNNKTVRVETQTTWSEVLYMISELKPSRPEIEGTCTSP